MNFKRIARMLVCLVLVCALVVNISPIKAEAIVPDTFTIGYVAKDVAMWALSAGIGISIGVTAVEVFEKFTDNFVTWLNAKLDPEGREYFHGELIEVWATGDPDCPYVVDWELAEYLRDYLFESETIRYTPGAGAPEGYAYFNGLLCPIPARMVNGLEGHYAIYNDGTSTYFVYASRSD